MLHAPAHRIDATPVLVLEDDSAWDRARITAEISKLKKQGDRHPFAVYQSGETRYDLGAVVRLPNGTEAKVTDYLDIGQAWQFELRRLSWSEVYAIEQTIRSNPPVGHAMACRMGLVKIVGPGAPKMEHDAAGNVTDESMQALFDLRASLPALVGQAVFSASLPLTASEKKP
jgi:hypothetical protein